MKQYATWNERHGIIEWGGERGAVVPPSGRYQALDAVDTLAEHGIEVSRHVVQEVRRGNPAAVRAVMKRLSDG